MRTAWFARSLAALGLTLLAAMPCHANDSSDPGATALASTTLKPPPLPADAHIAQRMRLDGHWLDYRVTVGSLPVRDDKGNKVADVVYTAYTVAGAHARPVTFALNGGPGAASVYLNFGAIGPKHIPFGNQGDGPTALPRLEDNPATWLDFTDLVFIDPVGTGFSRSLVNDKESTKLFFSTDADFRYLSRCIYDWLLRNGRMESPKYLVGESFGGYRGPRIADYLQTRLGVALRGMVLISPFLDPVAYRDRGVSPLPWMLTLPAITAAHLERVGRLTPHAMQAVIDYTRGAYAHALMLGNSDPAARDAMIAKVTELTGLDPAFVQRSGGRLDAQAYLREAYRAQQRVGSINDSNVSAWDPFPWSPRQPGDDPVVDGSLAPLTAAMLQFVTRTVGWKIDAPYEAMNDHVMQLWHRDGDADEGAMRDLRAVVADDPGLQVLIAHGWNDLTCPLMASLLIVDQMPTMEGHHRVRVRAYPGGHMFYTRPASDAALRRDAMKLYGAH